MPIVMNEGRGAGDLLLALSPWIVFLVVFVGGFRFSRKRQAEATAKTDKLIFALEKVADRLHQVVDKLERKL